MSVIGVLEPWNCFFVSFLVDSLHLDFVFEGYSKILIPSRKLKLFTWLLFLLGICHSVHQFLKCLLVILPIECVHGIISLQVKCLEISICAHQILVVNVLTLVFHYCFLDIFINEHLPASFSLQVFWIANIFYCGFSSFNCFCFFCA